jgi:HK97 family phage major capsid protein
MAEANVAQRHSSFGIQTGFLVGAVTAEANWKPVTQNTFERDTLGEKKVSAIAVATAEFLRNAPGSAALLEDALRLAIANARDSEFFTTVSSLATSVASIGVGSSGDVLFDISAMLAAMDTDNRSKLHMSLSPANAKSLSAKPSVNGDVAFPGMTPNGGSIAGIAVHVTDKLADDVILAFDASSFVADRGVALLEMSEHADVRMTDGTGTGATTVINLFQTNSRALKAEALYGYALLLRELCTSCGLTFRAAE